MNLLYITCNPKPQEASACLTVGRALADALLQRVPQNHFVQRNLYQEDIPELDFQIMTKRAALADGETYDALPPEAKAKVDRIRFLCNEFRQADRVIIAAPMWSLFFPGRLKNYLDCILIEGMTIHLTDTKVASLIADTDRRMTYVQASGGPFNSLFLSGMNYGAHYLETLAKTLGYKGFYFLPVAPTGSTPQEQQEAVKKAMERIPSFAEDMR